MAENNSVLVIAVLAVIASLAAAGFSYYAMSQGPRVSGFLSNVDTGTASLTVETVMEIEFTDDMINWSSGKVDTNMSYAILDSNAETVVNGSWTPETTGLTLENKGNVLADIALASGDTDAATFIGGTSPDYEWMVSSTACSDFGDLTADTYEDVAASAAICSDFDFDDADDTLEINVKVIVPSDAPIGDKSDTLTATASAVV